MAKPIDVGTLKAQVEALSTDLAKETSNRTAAEAGIDEQLQDLAELLSDINRTDFYI